MILVAKILRNLSHNNENSAKLLYCLANFPANKKPIPNPDFSLKPSASYRESSLDAALFKDFRSKQTNTETLSDILLL